MSGTPRVWSTNGFDSEFRPVLGSKGNKAPSSRKPLTKPLRKNDKSMEEEEVKVFAEEKNGLTSSTTTTIVAPLTPPLRAVTRQEQLLHSSLSLSASCSSDASSDSVHSRASTGRMYKSNSTAIQRRQLASKSKTSVLDGISEPLADSIQVKKRCAWVAPYTGALAELMWPAILSKRHVFREVFADFDPSMVAKFDEKKITAPGSTARSLVSELKLRAIIENVRQMSKIPGHR